MRKRQSLQIGCSPDFGEPCQSSSDLGRPDGSEVHGSHADGDEHVGSEVDGKHQLHVISQASQVNPTQSNPPDA